MTIYTIKIHHDPTCAWCYIGHRVLDESISLFQKTYPNASKDDFNISWLPFYRDRRAPTTGVNVWDLMVQSRGEKMALAVRTKVCRIGKAHGIDFTLKGTVGHTRDYQRVVWMAGQQGGGELQRKVVEMVYASTLEGEGADIVSRDFLADAAQRAGMDGTSVRDMLGSDMFVKQIDEADEAARANGIKAVPTMEINGVRVEGAEDVSSLYELFAKIKEGSGPVGDDNVVLGTACEEFVPMAA